MQNTKKICGQSQSFQNFHLGVQVYFIYLLVYVFDKKERNLGPVCLQESSFFFKWFSWEVNSRKINYFSMFDIVMENKLENTFQCLVMLQKMSWKIGYLCFFSSLLK